MRSSVVPTELVISVGYPVHAKAQFAWLQLPCELNQRRRKHAAFVTVYPWRVPSRFDGRPRKCSGSNHPPRGSQPCADKHRHGKEPEGENKGGDFTEEDSGKLDEGLDGNEDGWDEEGATIWKDSGVITLSL